MQGSELPSNKSTCPAEITLKVMSGRWKILIIQELWTEVKRFNQLQRSIQGITHKMLTEQLRELEADGVIHRQVYAEIPPKVEYSLTELGEGLKPILEQMHHWGKSPTN
ncbi:putative HTH-type transcriptional regulator YybR [Planktothrix tepida]|uniref:Putative transcriptional regulator superfamily n=1 Tax=Planktothrix tepida PCC 9214 TaxID=671072 RepID=A0A1J1LEG2_9CYAN|nr:helix-turn-helix domain-containing protein [Planktothrix tepida]CAD5919216.1 putative HTH-type transcriptional regulator YybR [Planktothrix tepida]CUR30840.1 putative transcriptional regulator superfamily [Planktothrix tepida PCC 9214]